MLLGALPGPDAADKGLSGFEISPCPPRPRAKRMSRYRHLLKVFDQSQIVVTCRRSDFETVAKKTQRKGNAYGDKTQKGVCTSENLVNF